MLWSDHHGTPRTVWTLSAIAAAVCHGGLLWWGIDTWQRWRTPSPPIPIQVITLPPASIVSGEFMEPTTVPLSAAAQSGPVVSTDQPPSFDPVTPNNRNRSPQEPAVPPIEPASPPAFPQPTPAPVTPITPTPPVMPEPLSPSAEVSSESRTPSVEDPIDTERPFPVTTGEISPRDAGIQAFWTPKEVPGGFDITKTPPEIPEGWRESTSTLLANASCASGLVASGSSVQVTLWPVVEDDGRISEFLSWDGDENAGKEAIIDCLEGLGPQMARLTPARDEAGEVIGSTNLLLVVEIQGTQ